MVVLSGAPHPVAANLWLDFNLDAQISADNTNYIGYMGPNAAASSSSTRTILADPSVNPDRPSSTSSRSCSTSAPSDLDKYQSAGTSLAATPDTRQAAAPRPRRRQAVPSRAGRADRSLLLPGVVWLGVFFLAPLVIIFVVSLGRATPRATSSSTGPNLQNYIGRLGRSTFPRS